MARPVVKMCGMLSAQEVDCALSIGADYVGFVGEGLTPPGCLTDDAIVSITADYEQRLPIVLLTPHAVVDVLVAQQTKIRAGALQLCHPLSQQSLCSLREQLPGVTLIQVVHMGDEGGFERACAVADLVDVVLLDSGSTEGEKRVYGGTGRVHNWSESAAIVEALDLPVWLAGGLTPSNIAEAITRVQPAGIDVCSGLRLGGELDEGLAIAFMTAVREAT